ncbi:MAG: DUF3048 domain-containing protein [Candidatus Limnocylindrales bacterium]
MIKRILRDRRSVAIAVSVIAVVAIVATGLLIVVRPGFTAQATATPTAVPSGSPTPLPSPSPTLEGSPTPIPTDWVYSDLDGLLAPKDSAHRLPMAIMIDDNIVARPQSGFSSASIVYQAFADGGEDRYMLVFQEGTASDIGPVRSARPYYVYWAAEYKAAYCHFGGDAESLQHVIPTMARSIYDMDAITNHCPYRRITTRVSPHNAYTTSSDVIAGAAAMHYPSTYQNSPVRTFKDDLPLAQRPASQAISIPYHTGQVGYTFDPATDSYLRSVDGKLQTDAANGQQVKARNIVVMFQALSTLSDGRPFVANVGSGKATVFLEGQAIGATWKKTSNTALTRLYDSSGAEIQLVRGEIFMQSVPISTVVTYR